VAITLSKIKKLHRFEKNELKLSKKIKCYTPVMEVKLKSEYVRENGRVRGLADIFLSGKCKDVIIFIRIWMCMH